MESFVNSRVKEIEISGIRKFSNMVKNHSNTISLTIGQPDFPTPEHIKQAAVDAIMNNETTYTHNAGFIELRQSVHSFMEKKYRLKYDAENEIIVTNGASQALDVAFRTLLDSEDEVIIPAPNYPGYEPLIKLAGAKVVYADTRNSDFKPLAKVLKGCLTDKTKIVLLNYPANPTGATLSKEELQDIADLIRGKGIIVIADEIYSELTYENEHVSIAEFLREQTIVINGLSKSHAMTGWRIGFLMGPEELISQMLKVHQYNVSCASSISQKAAIAALNHGFNDAVPMKNEYRTRRDYVYSRLKSMNLETTFPDGAFYFFVKIPALWNTDSFNFALLLVEEQHVALVPGSAFSPLGEKYFRLSYACSLSELEEGLNRLESFLLKHHL
jgi:aminotransferase